MAEKARDAFRTISEVANWLDVPAHVLRFWESKFTQIKPVKRAGGRRYYRPEDMRLIGGIKQLLHDDGLTIRGVQKMLKEEGVKHVSGLSPAIDMPSEEEGAARRDARRARRQSRQSDKADAASHTPTDIDATLHGDAQAPADQLHIADQGNVVPLSEHEPASTPTQPTEAPVTESPSVDPTPHVATHPGETRPSPPPSSQNPPGPSGQMSDVQTEQNVAPPRPADADDEARTGTDTDHGPDADLFSGTDTSQTPDAQTETAPQSAHDPIPQTPEPLDAAPSPTTGTTSSPAPVTVPDDPSLDTVLASNPQLQHAAALRMLRTRGEALGIAPQDRATLQTLYNRMQALQERMIADGVGP